MNTILVIDDKTGLRRSLCAYLENLNYDTLTASNGLEGLEVLREHLPKLCAVIVDLNIPVLNGYGFLEKATVETPEIGRAHV